MEATLFYKNQEKVDRKNVASVKEAVIENMPALLYHNCARLTLKVNY